MSTFDVGVDAVLNLIVNGNAYLLPVQLRGVSPSFRRATQPVLLSNGVNASSGAGNTLVGYMPSTAAESGFTIAFSLPYAPLIAAKRATSGQQSFASLIHLTATMGAYHILKAITTYYPAGAEVWLHLGASGDISCTGCYLRTLTVTGTEGGFITCTAAFDSSSLPTVNPAIYAGGTATADVYKFTDVLQFVVPTFDGASTWGVQNQTDVNSFTFTVTQQLAAFHGNRPVGIAKYMSVVRTEAQMVLEYLKYDMTGTAASIGASGTHFAQTSEACVIELDQLGGTRKLVITLPRAFQEGNPEQTGDTETFITERMTLKGLPSAVLTEPNDVTNGLFTFTGSSGENAALP